MTKISLPSGLLHQNIEIVIDEPKIYDLTIELEEPRSSIDRVNRLKTYNIVRLSGNLPGLHRLVLRSIDISNLKLDVHTLADYKLQGGYPLV
jgi:hypothetical protein